MSRKTKLPKPVKSQALTNQDPLARYLQEIKTYPMLTEQEELQLFQQYQQEHDVAAARKLVTSHLRLVARIAMEYRTAYHNVLDLVQEGNIGLLKAVQQFDPEKGARLGYYAQWWIRSYILKYILDNFRLIKLGTTKTQKRLFFNLMREKEKIESMGYYASPELLSKQLGVGAQEIEDMQRRLTQPEFALEAPVRGNAEGKEALLSDFLAMDEKPLDERIAEEQSQDILKSKFDEFATKLTERDKKILRERLLAELPMTLQEIADEYGITKERVRQLEERLLKQLRTFFEESGIEFDAIRTSD